MDSKLKDEISRLYCNEKLSIQGVQKALERNGNVFSRGTIANVVNELGIARTRSEAFKYRVFRSHNCKRCGEKFSAQSSRHFWCKKCLPTRSDYGRLTLYGISPEEYETRLANQNFACAICAISFFELNSRRIHVDHDHITNEVRGILCQKCNHDLAVLDNELWCQKAQNYRFRAKKVSK